jgi:hypothetical protein
MDNFHSMVVQHAGIILTHKFLLGELWNKLTDAPLLRVYVGLLRVCPETSGWITEFSEHEAD